MARAIYGNDNMTIRDINIPNLLGGVSTQNPTVRYPNQVTRATNISFDPVNGCHKRPNTVAVKEISRSLTNQAIATHIFKDSLGNRRALDIHLNTRDQKTTFNITDLEDTATPIIINGNNILNKYTDKSDLEFLTIGDIVYILDKSKKLSMGNTASYYYDSGNPRVQPDWDTAPHVGFVWVKAGSYSTSYDIEINGKRNIIETKGSLHDNTSDARNAEKGADTGNLTNALFRMFKNGTTPSSTLYASSTVNRLQDVNVQMRQVGNVIWIISKQPITIVNHNNTAQVETAVDRVAQISDLPPLTGSNWGNAHPYMKVAGDNDRAEDDYYMRYINGVWQESVPPSSYNAILNPAITTFRKSFNALGGEEWTIAVMELEPRKVGDNVTNPQPSFIGQNINGMFTYNNRFGIISGENIAMAESGEFIKPNFWNKTTLTSLDTDPIDISVATDEVNALHSVVELSDKLLAFSDTAQFVLEGDTPTNSRFYKTTAYTNNAKVKPISHGSFVYFVDNDNGVWEMSTNNITETTIAVDISEHAKGLFKAPIVQIVGDTENKTIMFNANDGGNGFMYVYRYHYAQTPQGLTKQQSAWSTWEFNTRIQSITKLQDNIYFYSTNVTADTAFIDVLQFDNYNKLTILDHLTKVERKSGKLPSDIKSDMVILDTNYKEVTKAVAEGDQYKDGDVFWGGYKYGAVLELSPLYIKGKPQLGVSYKRMFVNYEDTAYFEVVVDYKGRTQKQVFNNRFLSSAKIDRISTGDGTFEMVNFGDNKHTKITITSDKPYNYSIQGITYQCRITERRGG